MLMAKHKQFIDIKLSPKLEEEKIVTKCQFDITTQDIVVELDHEYNVEIRSPINHDDWYSTIQSLAERMRTNEVSAEHILLICDSIRGSAHRLAPVNGNTKSDKDNKKDEREFEAYKYSSNFHGPLYEAVILAGKRCYIRYDGVNAAECIKSVDQIVEESRTIFPPFKEEYGYRPYEFNDLAEILWYVGRARKIDIGQIYAYLKEIVCSYIDQDPELQILLTVDIIWSYFQDRFPTTRYSASVGDNGSGKSSEAMLVSTLAYRPVSLTNANAANINRILGCIEPGQCTIISDEVRGLDKNLDLLSILAEGYQIEGKVSKINDQSRKPEFYWSYCYKKIITERIANARSLKGLFDRAFQTTSYFGSPKYDIKEAVKERKTKFDILIDFRKLMLVYRLIHFKDPLPNIDVGVQGREKELVKPNLQLFYGSTAQAEIERALQYFLDERKGKKDVSIEPILHNVVMVLIERLGGRSELSVKDVWREFKDQVPGYSDVERIYASVEDPDTGKWSKEEVEVKLKRPNEYHTEDYGTIYLTTLSTTLEHTFGGIPIHHEKGNSYLFNKDKLAKVSSSLKRNTKRINVTLEPEEAEEAEAIRKAPLLGFNTNEQKNEEKKADPDTNLINIVDTNMSKQGSSGLQDNGGSPRMPSASSGSSAEPDFDKVKADLEARNKALEGQGQ